MESPYGTTQYFTSCLAATVVWMVWIQCWLMVQQTPMLQAICATQVATGMAVDVVITFLGQQEGHRLLGCLGAVADLWYSGIRICFNVSILLLRSGVILL
jgi:hypothetical protein